MARVLCNRNLRLLPLLLLVGVFGACGGDDDDDNGGGGGGGGGGGSGADVSGIWLGSLDVDSGPQNVDALLIVRSNGTIYMDTDIGILVGTGQTTGNAFSATTDGYSYQEAFPDGADFTLTGNITGGTSLSGAFSGAGESGTFDFDFEATLSALPAALTAVAGTYDADLAIRDTTTPVSVTIEADGDLTGTDGVACTLTGKVAVLESSLNIYSWNATLTGCEANGAATGIGIAREAGTSAGFHLVGKVDNGAISISSQD